MFSTSSIKSLKPPATPGRHVKHLWRFHACMHVCVSLSLFCPCPTHYCPCPTARDRGRLVYGLAIYFICSSVYHSLDHSFFHRDPIFFDYLCRFLTCQFFGGLGLALSFVGLVVGCCQSVSDRLNDYGKK